MSALFIDSYGTLWVSTYYGGLYRYNKEYDSFSIVTDKLGRNLKLSSNIVEDNQHRLWMGTYTGLELFDPVKGSIISTFYFDPKSDRQSSLASDQVRALAVDGETLWIGYGAGIFSAVNTNTLQLKHHTLPGIDNKNASDNFINSLCANGDSLWMTTWGKGVWIFNKQTQLSNPYQGIKSLQVNCVCKDKANNIWIGTDWDGLTFFDRATGKITFYVHDDYKSNSLFLFSL